MSEIQRWQSAEGLEIWPPLGYGKVLRSGKPTNGDKGYAPMCEWIDYVDGFCYLNVGTGSSAVWVQNDPSNPQSVFGSTGKITSSSATMGASGNLYKRILTVAGGISPSATAADKIVDFFTLPANSLMAAGQGIQVTLWMTGAATNNSRVIKVIVGATNTSPAIDGSVTVTAGTAILSDTQTTAMNNKAILYTVQLFKTGAAASNTQESMVTAIIFGSTHGGIGAWTDQTFTESGALNIAVTVNCATATTDIVYQGCEITGFN